MKKLLDYIDKVREQDTQLVGSDVDGKWVESKAHRVKNI